VKLLYPTNINVVLLILRPSCIEGIRGKQRSKRGLFGPDFQVKTRYVPSTKQITEAIGII
jgi:hypothetical protein